MTFSNSPSPGVTLQGGGGSGGGGGGTPGGSSGQVQYNNAGAFGGAAGVTTDGTDLTLASASKLLWSTDLILTRRGAANLRLGEADTGTTSATVTITIAVPGVVTWASHGLATGSPVSFTTTGALPTGIVSGTIYYAVVITTSTIQLASSFANAVAATPTVITTTGTQSGVHTGVRNAITQRLSVQSVTGVTDRPGADMLITGSQGTGTGAGGSIVFQVAPAGGSSGSAQNALATALTINSASQLLFAGSANAGLFKQTATDYIESITGFSMGAGTGNGASMDGSGLKAGPSSQIGFAVSNAVGTYDTILRRDDANKLALRNAAAAQRFNVYNTWTSSTNYETFKIDWITTANTVLVGTEKGSTGGTARALELQTDATTRLTIAATGLVTVASSLTVSGGIIRVNYINSADDAISWFHGNNTTNGTLAFALGKDNTRFQFGGTTSSFPAIKRSTTTLQARLADDSAFTNIQGKLTTDTAYTAGAVVATGYLTLYDSTGTAYRVPCLV